MQPAPQAPAQPWRSRLLDMPALVERFDPKAEPPWLLKPLVIPGTLAVIAGQGGSGKTWVMHEAANAVQRGSDAAGFSAPRRGRALIIDGEMGEWLTVQRFAQQGYSTDIDVMNAHGLNLATPEGRQTVFEVVMGLQPAFIGIDSLSALTSGADENSRETGDMVRWIRTVCEQSGAAGLLIHHAGWKEERTRGSSTIRDGADTVWYFKRHDDDGTRELNCDGAALKAPRWSRPPAPLYMQLRPTGGLVAIDRPPDPAEVKQQTQADALRVAVAAGGICSLADAAEALGLARNNNGKMGALLGQIGAHKIDGTYSLNGHGGPAI